LIPSVPGGQIRDRCSNTINCLPGSLVVLPVAVRRRELSIRLALGAARSSIVRLVVNHGLLLIGLALVIGISAAFGFTAFLSSLLFGVEARDPVTLVGMATLLAVIAIVASALPAWRASRIEPSRTHPM
jgi:ABC-type antimicrobial peptide transport system permease subunit